MLVNRIAAVILFVVPAVIVYLSYEYFKAFGIGLNELILTLIGYYGSNIAIGLGMHRLWSHNSYKASKPLEFFLMLLSAGTLQGPAIAWASDHQRHHAFTDKEQDPHSPLKYSSRLKGFLWSHIGWMLFKEQSLKYIEPNVLRKFHENKFLMFQYKYYFQLAAFMNIVPPAILGYFLIGQVQGALAGIIFIGIGRAIQQQVTFTVNSLCHFVGYKKYSNTTARNIWWMAPFLLGENWHDFHHAFAQDYRNGHEWYHFDVHKWLIWTLSKIGLARELVVTTPERIAYKAQEIANSQNI